jgi:hypothetical protein
MFNTLYTLLQCVLVYTELMHVCNSILAHMYSLHLDLPLNLGVTALDRSNSMHVGPKEKRTSQLSSRLVCSLAERREVE